MNSQQTFSVDGEGGYLNTEHRQQASYAAPAAYNIHPPSTISVKNSRRIPRQHQPSQEMLEGRFSWQGDQQYPAQEIQQQPPSCSTYDSNSVDVRMSRTCSTASTASHCDSAYFSQGTTTPTSLEYSIKEEEAAMTWDQQPASLAAQPQQSEQAGYAVGTGGSPVPDWLRFFRWLRQCLGWNVYEQSYEHFQQTADILEAECRGATTVNYPDSNNREECVTFLREVQGSLDEPPWPELWRQLFQQVEEAIRNAGYGVAMHTPQAMYNWEEVFQEWQDFLVSVSPDSGSPSTAQPASSSRRPSGTKGSSSRASTRPKTAKEKRFPCDSCDKAFSRTADKDRHIEQVHGPTKQWQCDYENCQRNKDFLGRKDHCREHYREYHHEDLPPRGKHDDPTWMENRLISNKWWRCSKCLLRVYIKHHGSLCPCGTVCESSRIAIRQQHFAQHYQARNSY